MANESLALTPSSTSDDIVNFFGGIIVLRGLADRAVRLASLARQAS